MAQIPASVNLEVKGGSKLERLIQSVGRLESIVSNINGSPLQLNVGKAETAFNAANAGISAVRKSIRDAQKDLNSYDKIVGNLEKDYIAFEKAASKLTIGTKAHADALLQAIQAEGRLANAKNKRLGLEKALEKQEAKLPGAQRYFEETQRVARLTQALTDLSDEYLKFGKLQARTAVTGKIAANQSGSGSIAGLKAQADALSLVANNSEIASRQFNRFTIASQVAGQRVFEARQKQLTALAEGLSVPSGQARMTAGVRLGDKESLGAARSLIGTFVESYGAITKSRAALSDYISQASSLQSIVPFDSSEWNLLETVINDVNGELQQLEQRFKGLRGQSSNLAQAVADGIAPGIAAPRGRGPSQLLPQFDIKSASDKAKYYSKIEDQVSRLAGFEERIAQANLTQVQKVELRSRLDKALSLLSENRLEDAKRETVEIEKQRMSLERMNRAGSEKPQGLAVELGGGAELRERNKYEAEQVRLRGQIAEATNTAAAAVQRLEAAQGRISMVQEFEEIQSGINSVSDKVDAFLEKDKRALRKFNQTLKETSATIKQVKQGVAVDLGGGAEVRERAKFEESTEKNLRRRNSILASGAIIEQGLFNLRSKGVNVDQTLEGLQRSLNAAKLEEFEITSKTLDALSEQVSLAGKYAQLQRTALAGQSGAGGKKASPEGTGLEAALKKLEEARGARQKFLGSASPAQAIDQIVREFNKGKPGSGAGANVVNTLLSEASAGVPKAAVAGEQLGKAVEDGLNDGLGIQSPSRVAIEAMLNVINTLVSTAKSGKAKVQAALEDLVAPKLGNVQKSPLLKSLTATTEDTIEKLSNFIGRASAKPSLYRPLARLAGPELLSGGAVPQAMQRKAFEAGKILPETRLLPLSERRLLRGSANAPGGGLESEVLRAAIKGVSGTGAFVGPLASSVRGQGAVASRLFPALSQGPAGLGGTGIFPVRPQPRVGAPGSAFPFQSYQMGSAQQFPVDKAINLLQKGATRSDANRALADAISRYRDAVNNFWEGEDSQFEAISKVVKSSVQVGGAKLARKFTESGRGAGLSEIADVVSGEKELGVSRFVGQSIQRISDSILNSIEPLAYSIGDSFKDGIDRIRSGVPNAVSRGLSAISGGFGGFGGFGGAGGGGAGGAGDTPNQAAQLLGLDGIGDISRASVRELEALSAAASELRAVLDPTTEGFDRLDNQLRETIGQIGRQLERRDPNADFLTRQFGPRGGRAVSEGLIGGAFPLLFGQGLGASAGGAVGGALGGFAGGGLGFGLSLVGTAAGTAIDTTVQSAIDLGKALEDPIKNFQTLADRSLVSSRALEKQIEKTIEAGDTATAYVLIQQDLIKTLGSDGAAKLKAAAEASDRLNRAWAELSSAIQVAIAGPLAGFLDWVNSLVDAAGRRPKQEAEIRQTFKQLPENYQQEFNKEVQKRISAINVAAPANKAQPSFGMLQGVDNGLPRQQGMFDGAIASGEIAPIVSPQAIQDIRAQVAKEFKDKKIPVTIELKKEQKWETEIAVLQKQLEGINLGESLAQQARAASREQSDLERQRAELVRSYEESIASIRKSVEDKIGQQRIENARLEIELKARAGDLELAKIKAANQEFRGLFSDTLAGDVTNRVLDAVESVTQSQNQAAAQRAELELSVQNSALEVEKFKIDVARQVTSLNEESIRRVDEINQGIIRRNEDANERRFLVEKAIAVLQLRLGEAQAKQDLKLAEESLKNQKGGPNEQFFTSILQLRNEVVDIYTGGLKSIENLRPPEKLQEIRQFAGASVSTAGVSELNQVAINRQRAIQGIGQQIAGIAQTQDLKNITDGLDKQIEMAERLFSVYERGGGSRTKDLAAEQVLQEAISAKLAEQKDTNSELYKQLNAMLETENGRLAIINRINQAQAAQFKSDSLLQLIDKQNELAVQVQKLSSGYGELTEVQRINIEAQVRGISLADEQGQALLRQAEAVDMLNRRLEALQAYRGLAEGISSTFAQGIMEIGSAITGVGNLSERIDLSRQVSELEKMRSKTEEGTDEYKNLTNEINRAKSDLSQMSNVGFQVQDALAKMMQGIADAFAEMAAQIIAKQTIMIIYGAIMKALGIAGSFGGASAAPGGIPSTGNVTGPSINGFDTGSIANLAAKGAYFDGKTSSFANGGMFTNSIVSSPTLFKFADGGLTRNGLMGEAGPEAIMPLTRGPDGRLGVDANGLSDAIAEARGALDETGLNLDGQDSEEAQSANSDQNTFNNSDRKAAAATDSVKELNYVLQDSRGAIEDMKRVSRDREAAAAAIAASPDAKELYKLLAPMGKETSTIRELLGSSAGSDSASIAGILGSDGRQGDQSDAILAARNAIADGIEINAGQVDGSASDAITSSRELVEKINNTEKAQLAIQSQEDKSALDSARSAVSTDASTKQYFNTKVENNAGQVDGSTSSVIRNSREFVEKINNTEKAQLAAQSQENKSALDSARSAISKDSSTKEYFDTKESSALMQARETTDSMMALTQTRQMLNSVATVNKERSVERAIEATASGPVKPIDVRYESQVINSVEYVTAEQHRKGISEAAERGRSLTLSALKNSVKARRQIGM